MRLRHKKGLENIDFGNLLIKLPFLIDTSAYQYSVLEIGCGKGGLIFNKALLNKDILYIAYEYNLDALVSLINKKKENNLENLIIVNADASDLLNYIKPSSINEINLFFSDPWPKKRHHKRRLTYYDKLEIYKEVLKKDGFILFKTDDPNFFNDSVEYFNKYFKVDILDYKLDTLYTEYEYKKNNLGLKINYLKAYYE